MSYLGQPPVFGEYPFQIIAGNGGTDYELNFRTSGSRGVLVFVDGAVHRPDIDFDVRGGLIKFKEAIPTDAEIFVYGMGLPKSRLTPSLASVGMEELEAEIVQKMNNLDSLIGFVGDIIGTAEEIKVVHKTNAKKIVLADAGNIYDEYNPTNVDDWVGGDSGLVLLGGEFGTMPNMQFSSDYAYIETKQTADGGKSVIQFAYDYGVDGAGTIAGNTAVRIRASNGQWSSWRVNYHNENVVGVVSHVDGVPTGAIFERGRNANGFYVRYADGTQICTGRKSGASIEANNYDIGSNGWGVWSQTEEITFPAEFIDTPEVSGNAGGRGKRGSSGGLVSCGYIGNASCEITAWSHNESPREIGYIAVGRWYD